MRHLFIISFLTISILNFSSCEAPRDRRAALRITDPNALSNNSSSFNDEWSSGAPRNNNGGNNNQNSENGNNGSGGGSSSGGTIPDEIKHCSWSMDGVTGYESIHNHLGEHTICQSKNNRADIYIQTKSPINDAQVCLIPTSSNGGKSIYIGEARCLMLSDPMRIYKATLLRNRPGFQNFTITGLMLMKDKSYFFPAPFHRNILSVDAYLFCSEYLDKYNNNSYCQAFRSVGQYIYKEFF